MRSGQIIVPHKQLTVTQRVTEQFAGAEDGWVERVAGHGEVVRIHEVAVEVLVLGEETQADQADVEVGIDIDDGVVADQRPAVAVRLQAELRGGRAQQRGIVRRVITDIDAELGIHGTTEPAAVVVQVAVQGDVGQRKDSIGRVLPDDVVLPVDPRCGEVEVGIDGYVCTGRPASNVHLSRA